MSYKNKEKQNEYNKKYRKEYYIKNKEKILKRVRENREKNKENFLDYNRKYNQKYYKTHKEKIKESARIYRKKYRESNPDVMRDKQLKRYYGITLEQYNEMFDKQGGCCVICGRHQDEFKRTLSVDHDHITGKVRGLLCTYCNTILGYSKDNTNIFKNMINYLEKYK